MPKRFNKIISSFADLPTSKCLLCKRQSIRNQLWFDENEKPGLFMCGKNTIYKYGRKVDFDATIDNTHYLIDIENQTAVVKLSDEMVLTYECLHQKKQPKLFISHNNGENEAELPFQSLNFSDLPSLQLHLQKLINFL